MSRRVILFGIAVELLSSFLLYVRAPTDGVRVWYPSIWAYMGEHGLVWGFVIAFLLVALRNRDVGEAPTALACFASEVVATLYVWFVIPREGEVSRAWYIGRFSDYFKARLVAWCILALCAAAIYTIGFKRHKEINP
jgi:hypothetical protein